MVVKKVKQVIYPDTLVDMEQPIIKNWEEKVDGSVDVIVVKTKKVPVKKKCVVTEEVNKLSSYNQFIKDKRAELIALNPNTSKGVIYEMAKQAYRDMKCNIRVGKAK